MHRSGIIAMLRKGGVSKDGKSMERVTAGYSDALPGDCQYTILRYYDLGSLSRSSSLFSLFSNGFKYHRTEIIDESQLPPG
jgi:hypothetical protein